MAIRTLDRSEVLQANVVHKHEAQVHSRSHMEVRMGWIGAERMSQSVTACLTAGWACATSPAVQNNPHAP